MSRLYTKGCRLSTGFILRNGQAPAKMKVTHSREEQPKLNSAILALEDGTVFEGRSFGAPAERSGEVVFNTALTGYQEVFTDPSYSGQIVILTNPQIGNYGTSREDNEAGQPYIEGLVVREFSGIASNWRSDADADAFLAQRRHPGGLRPRHARAGAPPAHARRDARRAFGGAQRCQRAGGEGAQAFPPWPGSIWPAACPPRSATSGRRRWSLLALGTGRRAARRANSTWWRTISASSTTFCGGWCRWAAASPWCPR